MKVPLVDLKDQYQSIKKDINRSINKSLKDANFIGGSAVSKFEDSFSKFNKSKYCVCVGNGTDALVICLMALGIKAGDEVIVPTHTFISTSEAVRILGATPVMIDIEEETFNINSNLVIKKINKNTKAIIPVHLYGKPADLIKLRKISKKFKIPIISDAAQAHNSLIDKKNISFYSKATCFSFYPGKNLGAYGDGGAIVSNDKKFVDRIRMIANHGRKTKYLHEINGLNSRLDSIQASILSVKLKYLLRWSNKRINIAKKYNKLLSGINSVRVPKLYDNEKHVFHLYVIRVDKDIRDILLSYLNKKGIGAGIHYPIPLHMQPCNADLKYIQGDFPISEQISKEIISLPIYPEINNKMITYVVKNIINFFDE